MTKTREISPSQSLLQVASPCSEYPSLPAHCPLCALARQGDSKRGVRRKGGIWQAGAENWHFVHVASGEIRVLLQEVWWTPEKQELH